MTDAALVSAFLLDGQGGGKTADWEDIEQRTAESDILWMHLNYTEEKTQQWVRNRSGLDPLIIEALLAEDTRPRCLSHQDGLLVILRGVNLNPGADADDMVSIRVWLEPGRIITIRHRRIMAIEDLRQELADNDGPRTVGDFLVHLTDRLSRRMANVLADLDDNVDGLEDKILDQENYQLRGTISNLRRQIIRLRRYLAPQRDVMVRLQAERVSWLEALYRAHLQEVTDRITRYVEDLDSAKDRAAVAQDELESRLAGQMNKTMYLLSIVAAIFLPLGLLTGLLGINVAGIPGTENPYAFTIVCVILVVVAILQILIFRKIRWM